MTRYWVIAPYDSTKTEAFDKAWEYDLKNGTIAVGWDEMGDVSGMSKAELAQKYRQVYGESRNLTRDCNTLWRFYHEIAPGDVIVARRGTKRVVGIGSVAAPAFHDEQKGKERVGHLADLYYYPNFITVNWEAKQIEFDHIVFSRYTMYEIPEEGYRELTGAPPPDESQVEFVLEKYLEDFIVTNFNAIFPGQLELCVDGQQYQMVGDDLRELGRIDILAREPATGCYVVIELKKGRESDVVVGQTLRYMGWVQENLCQEGEGVKGLIVCKDQDERLRYALKALPGSINVKFYTVSFQVSDHPAPA
jgi:hypothetical protein